MFAHALSLTLLAICAGIALIGPALESRQRAPERTVQAYLDAIEREDLQSALEAVSPDARVASRDRVELQLGNRYRIEVLVLGNPSLLDRLRGAPGDRAWANVIAVVTPVSGQSWKSSAVVQLAKRDGRWYLLDPPFA